MPTLIITEKPNVAERIAKAIGRGEEKKFVREGAPYHMVGDIFIAPAVGHIFGLREKKKDGWRYPVFDIEWAPSYLINKNSDFTKKYLDNLQFLAKKCDKFINACDYDIEGEVIAFNAIKYACGVDPLSPNVRRMKFSTLTSEAILEAYRKLEGINKGMAEAGITRHKLDWFWGINLSRALTLSIRRSRGYVTLSIGRVQGPTLKLLATREESIKSFKPEPYWEIEMLTLKDKNRISSLHIKGKIWSREEAEKIKAACGKTAVVEDVQKKKTRQDPPTPFDLTTLQTEAYKQLGLDPSRTLQLAQELYTNAFISYPRTSSQQLPDTIPFEKIIRNLSRMAEYEDSAKTLLAKKELKPNNGKKTDPAHPAIYPTGEIPEKISDQAEKLFDLIVRRFLATFGEPAYRETVDITFNNNEERFVAEGIKTVEKGWHTLYGKYAKFDEQELPEVEVGEKLPVEDIKIHDKETKPPKRYTPASIIKEMEKRGLGTKATRSQIIDILFRRGYAGGKSIEVTPLGLSVVKTLEKHCPEVLSENLTRKFEKEMEEIEAGKIDSEKVLKEGIETLVNISRKFKENEKKIGDELAASLKADVAAGKKILGKCLKCDGNLVMRKSKYGEFVGCDKYPECKFLLPLPKAKVIPTTPCPECGYVVMQVKGRNEWSFCVNPECKTRQKGYKPPEKPPEETIIDTFEPDENAEE